MNQDELVGALQAAIKRALYHLSAHDSCQCDAFVRRARKTLAKSLKDTGEA